MKSPIDFIVNSLPRLRSGPSACCGIAVLLLAAAGCGGGGQGGPPAMPIPVETVSVGTESVQDRLTAVGSIQANEEVTLMPEAAGRIRSIHFREGESVNAGALLFELDNEKESAQLAQARADLNLARQNAARANELAGTRAISKQEIDQIQSEVALKEAIHQYQESRLAETKIHAPFGGILGPRNVSPGQFVNIGDELVTLTDDSVVKVTYRVPEKHIGELNVGQSVKVRVEAYPDRAFTGEVDLINPQVDPQTRTIEVRAVIPNPERRLRPGMFANIETITGTRENAVVIPEKAVIPSLEGFSVFLVVSNTSRLTPVTIGVRLPGKVEIREGLETGQMLIVSGLQKIVDGSAVEPQPAGSADPQPETTNTVPQTL